MAASAECHSHSDPVPRSEARSVPTAAPVSRSRIEGADRGVPEAHAVTPARPPPRMDLAAGRIRIARSLPMPSRRLLRRCWRLRDRVAALLAAGGPRLDPAGSGWACRRGIAVALLLARPPCVRVARRREALGRVRGPPRAGRCSLVAGVPLAGVAGAVRAAARWRWRWPGSPSCVASRRPAAAPRVSSCRSSFGVLVLAAARTHVTVGPRGRRAALPDGRGQPPPRRRPRRSSATTPRGATRPSTTRRSSRTTACAGATGRSTRSTRSACRS